MEKRSSRVSIPGARGDSLPGRAKAMEFFAVSDMPRGRPEKVGGSCDAGAVGGVLSEMWRLETLEVGATYQMLSQIARIETIFTFSGYA